MVNLKDKELNRKLKKLESEHIPTLGELKDENRKLDELKKRLKKLKK